MSISETLERFAAQLTDALGQHTAGIADVRAAVKESVSQFTIAQLGIGSLGTQIDDAEGRSNRRVDRLERKLDALLRSKGLDPKDYENE